MSAPAWLSLLDGFEVRMTLPRAAMDGRDGLLSLECLACGADLRSQWAQSGYSAGDTMGDLARAAKAHTGTCSAIV